MRKLRAVIPVLACLFLAAGAGKEAIAQERVDDVEGAFAEAMRLHQSGDIEGAIRGYLAILAKRPELGDVRSNLGAAYARLGRYEDAIAQYKQVLARDQRNQTVRYNLALAYYKAAMFTEAAAEMAPLIESISKDQAERLSAILILADCLVRLGEYKKTIDLLSPLETTYSDNRAFAYLFGNALISANQIAKGQALIDRVFRGEDSAEARLLIGSILLLADDKQAAVKEFERAIELNPKLPSLHAWYGRALMRLGDGDGAITAFKSELSTNPNDFEANLYLGILLKRDKSLDEAFEYLSRAARLRPRDSYSRFQLASLHAARGKPGEALPLLEAVTKEYPDFIEARVLLASVYYRLNRKADGDRERAIAQKLNAEQQAKEPGAQDGAAQPKSSRPPTDPQNDQKNQ
ncbi:MAG: tetratricopeptide repeat protein [Chloracidobacterium sp.]|nr:tetratricopeptide repeat protein [Chloracidobacterium sp.]